MNSLKDLAKVLKKSKRIALFTHVSPDFDALGSVFALYYSLKNMAKEPEIFIEEQLSTKQKSLVEEKLINHGECDQTKFDTFVCCDVSDIKRLGAYSSIYEGNNNTIVLDHHLAVQLIGKYNHIDASISSCAELVYDLLKIMKVKFSTKTLSMVYAGLASDTNSFINTNTNEHSFRVAYEITKAGVDTNFINETLFKTLTKTQISFQQYLWNNYKINKDCAYILLDNKTLQSLKGEEGDYSGFSAKLISIQNVKYSFSLVEKEPGVVTVSLRSRKGYDVRSVAEKLGGGGHLCASGAKINTSNLSKIKTEILKAINQAKAEK